MTRSHSRYLSTGLALLMSMLTLPQVAWTDWPGWMGSNRDNRPTDLRLPADFRTKPPTKVWEVQAAGGYAGPAVVKDRVYLFDYRTGDDVSVANFQRQRFTGQERVRCLDAHSGNELWKHQYPVTYTVSYPAGPRCTPTVDGDRVYTLGTEGNLICFDCQSGQVRWQKDFPAEYATKTALWGYASHPLIHDDLLICIVGGQGSHVVAFDKLTGDERWRNGTASEQGYVSPTLIEASGWRQLITANPDDITSRDPATGQVHWTVPYQADNGSIIMSPVKLSIKDQDYLFVGGYSNRNLLLRLAAGSDAPDVVWQDARDRGISPVNVQPMVRDNLLYGMDQKGLLMAVEFPSGKRLWQTSQPLGDRPLQTGTAFLMQPTMDDRFLMFTERGDLVMARLSPDGFREIDRVAVIEPTGVAFGRKVVWSAPAIADNRVYVRNDKELICLKL